MAVKGYVWYKKVDNAEFLTNVLYTSTYRIGNL